MASREPVGEVQVDGHRLQQAGAGGGVVADVAQRGLVERDGLPVRARAGRLRTRRGGVAQDPGDVARRRSVVGEHARVAADRFQRLDHRRVQRRLGAGYRRAEHRRSGDLVAERDAAAVPVEQAGAGEHLDRRRRDAECGEQLGADGFGGARQQLQAPPGVGGQPGGPGQHGVADALGQRRLRLGEDLADEERVARGAAVDVDRVEPVSVEERGDRGPAQRGQLQPARVRRADEVAEDRAERVVGAERVAVRQHEQQRQRSDPAGEEPHEVERRLVRPVQVLDDEHARAGAQGVEHRGEDLVLGGGAAQQGGDVGAELVRDVAERAERAGRAQRVAHAPQRLRLRPRPLDEGAQEDGLADARLAGDEDDATRGRRRPGERGPRSPRGDARAPAVAWLDRRSPNNPRVPREGVLACRRQDRAA